jgi:SAM-dependent methyltransferase/quercetin dioxygenase-like cupin family protein
VLEVVPIEHAALCDFAAPAGNLAAPARIGEQVRLEALEWSSDLNPELPSAHDHRPRPHAGVDRSAPAQTSEGNIAKPNLLLQPVVTGMPKAERQEVRVLTATFKPGDKTVYHIHRFPVTVYVLWKGTLTLELERRAPIVVKAGEALVEPPHVPTRGYNRSTSEHTPGLSSSTSAIPRPPSRTLTNSHIGRKTAMTPTPTTPMDAEAFKLAARRQWDACAQGWNDKSAVIRNWLRESTDALLAMADIKAGARVLDVAAGAGDQTLDIARRVGPTGHVLATDISPVILAFAEENARRAGQTNVETRVEDGETCEGTEGSFDAAICRLGLMLFPDPGRGLSRMFRALKPGGRACTMVFSSPERNPCISILVSTAFKHAGLPPPDPYRHGGLLSLGKPGLMDEVFLRAGFSHVATTKAMAPFRLPSVQDYLDFVRTSASPILQILGRLDDVKRDAAWAEIADQLSGFNTSDGWEGPNELLLTVGQRSMV